MIYNQNNLDVCKITSQYYDRVLFTKNKTVATDAVRLIEITTPSSFDIADFPGQTVKDFEPFCVVADSLSNVKAPKKHNLPICNNVAIEKIEDLSVTFQSVNGSNNVHKSEVDFPEYEKLFPDVEPMAEVKVNGKLLSEILVMLAKLDKNKFVTLKLYGKNKSIILEAGNSEQQGRALVMPINQ